MLRPLKDVLALLTTAGFTGGDALRIYRVFFGYLYGHILTELQEVVERPEETDDVLRLGLHRLAITEFPPGAEAGIRLGHSRRRRGTRPRPRPVAHWPHRHDVGSRRVTFVEVNERHILTHSKELLLGRSEPEFGQVVSASWTRRPCIAACVARDGSRPNHAGRQHLRTQFMDNRHYP